MVLSIGTLQVKAKELPRILSLLTGNTSSFFKNSAQLNFCWTDLKHRHWWEGGQPSEFDVVSLLTKVPIDEALDVLALRLKEDSTLFERTAIPPEDIHRLAELCYAQDPPIWSTKSNSLSRLRMQSWDPLSPPIIANIYIWSVFKEIALKSPPLKAKLWHRYRVDDTFVINVGHIPHPPSTTFEVPQ